MTDVIKQISDFVHSDLLGGGDRISISEEEDLLANGHIDSMGIMRLVAFLETEFGLSVPPEDVTIDHFLSVRAIANYVECRRDDH